MSAISIPKLFPFSRVKLTMTDDWFESVGVHMKPDLRFRPICAVCGSKATGIHSHHSRTVRDLPLGQRRRVHVNFKYRKIECERCVGFHVEDLGIADPGGPRVTQRFARYIYELCQLMTVKEVADHLGLNWKTVKEIDKRGLREEYGDTDYSGLRYLAIDEIAYRSHHRYLTIVIDFDTGRVVWIGKERTTKTLDTFFEAMPNVARECIEAVAMDMWEPFAESVRKWCPQASIVYDPFHIIAKYHDVIDEVRREEARQATGDLERKVVKGSRWLLLKNRDAPKQAPRLQELLDVNQNLSKVYVLKDDLKAIWHHTDRTDMAEALTAWCQRAKEADLAPVNRFVETLLRHAHGILNHADHPIHNGRIEGVNNKIKVIKREAYGYHDLEYFCLKIKQRCPGRLVIHQRLRR